MRIALLICSNVIGGHEFQAAALSRSLAQHSTVEIFVNRPEHAKLFQETGLRVSVVERLLLKSGTLLKQWLDGWFHRREIRDLVTNFDHVVVSSGAVEAGIAAGVALRGYKPISMYLPFFYDRVPNWGRIGHLYNCMLASSCRLFDRIITINRIQAFVIYKFSGVSTIVVTNKIREVKPALERGSPRLVFVGRLDHQKRIDELMQWLDTEVNPVSELLLIGDGPLRSKLEQKAQTLTYLNCTFLGWKSPEEQDRLIRSSDILVLNSLLEGEPLVIREARARGMHIVVRNIVGTRGITSRSERFNTRDEFIQKLICFNDMAGSGDDWFIKKNISHETRRNDSMLALQRLMREHTGTRINKIPPTNIK
jgi:glycosyltransferase involved in cell wall biosynthesis